MPFYTACGGDTFSTKRHPAHRCADYLTESFPMSPFSDFLNPHLDPADLPDENPSPVLRATGEGVLTYANNPGQYLMSALGCSIGQKMPDPFVKAITHVMEG